MRNPLNNPEFLRCARAQLRPSRLVTTLVIVAALSAAVAFLISREPGRAERPYGWGIHLLEIALYAQFFVLAAGGGIACLNSIHKEKEQNTFDFQRVTRLSPAELTLGKLFGAPILSYFVCLCLMPVALFGAFMAKARPSIVLAAYVALFVGSLMFHAFALLISLLTIRGSHASAIILVLLVLWISSYDISAAGMLRLGKLGPFFAVGLVQQTDWKSPETEFTINGAGLERKYVVANPMVDLFFGKYVPHFPLFVVVDLAFAAWFLLGVVRNIKRDPDGYQLYSPMQALAFAGFLNLLLIAFFRWRSATPIDCQSFLLTVNMLIFFAIGLTLLRNRQQVRRLLRVGGSAVRSWLNTMWPAPLLFAGSLLIGIIIVAAIARGRDPQHEWSAGFAVFRSAFFVAWLLRDLQYLQWASLRRGRHPLPMGMLFLIIFYACVMILLAAFRCFSDSQRLPFTAFFLPSPVYVLNHALWIQRPAIWVAAFGAQWILWGIFIWLQRQTIAEMTAPQNGAISPAFAD